MKIENAQDWLPPFHISPRGEERRVGVEIEYAGLDAECALSLLCENFGGNIEVVSRAEYIITNTSLGEFRLELDATAVKQLAGLQSNNNGASNETESSLQGLATSIGDLAVDFLQLAAEHLVPWEIVSPPVPVSSLQQLAALVAALRKAGALGTRHALRYAFGVHLNPELPALDADTILRYLRAYFVLFDWISAQEQVDTARKITPYIDHFDKDYISLVIDDTYAPTIETLIDDYLEHNPTRNRSLDMLPLFAHLDESRVRGAIDDPRIKPRPTFHYRLPNCDIDAPDWNIDLPWSLWLEVEKLAHDQKRLANYCALYASALTRLTHRLDGQWAAQVGKMLDEQ